MPPKSPNITGFIAETNDENFQALIRGHLYLEALLGEIIERAFPDHSKLKDDHNKYYHKVLFVRAAGRLNDREEELLLAVNTVRNKLAHRLDFALNFDTAFNLLTKAKSANIDFSDEDIFNKGRAEENYGVAGVILETICNTFDHIVWKNKDLFSKKDISRFIG